MDIKSPADRSAEELLAKVASAGNVGTKDWLEDYIYARIWKLVLNLSNCDPDQKNLLIEYKCEIRSLLLIAQEIKLNLAQAEVISKELRKRNQVRRPGT